MDISKSVHADPSLTAVAGVFVGIAMSLNALATSLLVPLAGDAAGARILLAVFMLPP
jgi:hypothetical protein